ncbi:MAG: lipopolysaccharide biosynthesis protein [Gammaproteobacteria bacterium]
MPPPNTMPSGKYNAINKLNTAPEVAAEDVPVPDEGPSEPPVQHYSGSKIRRSMWHYLFGRGMVAIGSFAVALLLVRFLPVETYGAYTALAGLLVTLGIISDGGLDRILPKFLPMLRMANVESRLTKLCWKLLGLRVIFILIALIPVLLAPDWIASLLSIDEGADIIWPFALYVVLSIVSVHLARTLQAFLQQRDVTHGMALEWFVKLAAMLIVLGSLQALPLGYVIWIQALTVGLCAFYLLIKLQQHLMEFARAEHPPTQLDLPRERLWRFGLHNYLPSLINIVLSEGTIKLVSAYYLGITQTAALGFAYAITGAFRQYLPAVLLLGLIEPAFMARYTERRDFAVLNQLGSIVLKCNLFILAPAAVWLLLCGTPLVGLITGGKYLDTVWLLSGFIVAMMLYSQFLVLQLIVNAIEESWLLFTCNAWGALFALAQVAAMIIYGLPGLLIGLLFLSGFKNIYLAVKIRSKNYPYKPDWNGIARILILAVLSGLAGSLALRWIPGIPGSLLSLVIATTTFLVLAYFWKPFKPAERDLLNRFIGRKLFVW